MATTYGNIGEVTVFVERVGQLTRWTFSGTTDSSNGIANKHLRDTPINAELLRVITCATSTPSSASTQKVELIDGVQSDQLGGLVTGKALNAIARTTVYDVMLAGVQARSLVVAGPQAFRLTLNANEALQFNVVIEGYERG